MRVHVMKSRINGDIHRDTDHIHPSEMAKADWCPRETYFRMTHENISDPEANPSFQMESIFEEGHEIHRKWQGWFWEMGVLFGWWECLGCEHYWEDLSPTHCPECGEYKDIIRYREVPISVPSHMLLGHSDGAVHDGNGNVLIEVKSIGVGTLRFEAPTLHQLYLEGTTLQDIWKKIKRPFATHLIQGLIYLWAKPEYDEIVFIYEYKANQSVKELRVRRNDALIARHLASCQNIVKALRSGFPPYRPDWASEPTGPKCRSCVYRSTCWGLEQENDGDQAGEEEGRRRLTVRKAVGGRKGAIKRAGAAAKT